MNESLIWMLNFLKRIPLIGHALNCGVSEHLQTAAELFPGLFSSMLPIWVGTFIALVNGPSLDWHGLHVAFSGQITGGELFIYAAAFLAPILWIIHHVPPGAEPFPTPLAHGLLTGIITVFCAVAFELQKPGQSPNVAILHRLAIAFFWSSVLLIYLATLYHNHRMPVLSPDDLKGEQNDMLLKFRRRHP